MAIAAIILALMATHLAPSPVQIVFENGKTMVNGIPKGHEMVFAGQVNSNTFFVVECSLIKGQYADSEQFYLHWGTPTSMKPTKVSDHALYRDGGSIQLDTEKGRFWFPFPECKKGFTIFGEDRPWTLDGKILKPLAGRNIPHQEHRPEPDPLGFRGDK